MRQRGRENPNLLNFPRNDEQRSRINSPGGLTKEERALFIELAAGASHLTETDAPMLAAYVQSILVCRRLARNRDKVNAWEKAARVQTMLARSLRLTVKARIDPQTVGRSIRRSTTSYYDRTNNDDEK